MRSRPLHIALAFIIGGLSVWGIMALADLGEMKLAGKPASHYFPDDNVEALVRASAEGNVPAMQAAIEAGADANYAGFENIRPLFWSMHAHIRSGSKHA